MASHDSESLLNRKPTTQPRSSSSPEEWAEGSSYSTHSSYSDSYSEDSYVANWENHIASDGALFYAEYSFPGSATRRTSAGCENALNVMKGNDFSRASTRRSTNKKSSTSRLSRLIGKSEKRDETKGSSSCQASGETSKVTFSEGTQGEVKEIEFIINPENRFKYGRRATVAESMLGFSTSPFPGSNRLMVAGFMANSEISNEKLVKVGDWFKSINNMEMNVQNIDDVLNQFIRLSKVVLKFQRTHGEEQITPNYNTIQQIVTFESFAGQAIELLTSSKPPDNSEHGQKSRGMVLSLMILTLEFSDADIEANDVIFCYPEKEQNVLFGVRGSFLTLNSILKSELRSEPITSSVIAEECEYHICYHSYNKILLLYAVSSKYCSLEELRLRTQELVQYFYFLYLGLDIVFTEVTTREIRHVCEVLKAQLIENKGLPCFEKILQESHLVPLPKEAQLRIYDAISEMEAMDYREWNDEPLNSHREFFIFGSALYFKSYLLASHLPIAQLVGLESFLRCRGIFDFIERQNVRDFVLWQEIPMMSATSRYFLAISSRNQLLLAMILQSFEVQKRIAENGTIEEKVIGPSLFYIEEIQETLDHLRYGGIEALARVWMTSNKRPEIVVNPIDMQNKNIVATAVGGTAKRTEVISILKHRGTSSEDVRVETSAGGSSIQSEDSNPKLDEGDSDSDWDGFPESHKSSSGFDLSEMKDTFLKEISDIVPSRINAGRENVLYHYIHLDIGTGMILSPPEIGIDPIIKSFRNACYLIHTVLQNTKKFRRLLAQESIKPNTHKSLVAIKEHGVLISARNDAGIENSFWVVGRLFTSPTRELYVCHRSDIPQNLVEIAFRLSFLTAG